MHYSLIRLRFKTPLHMGGDGFRLSLLGNRMQVHADTLFSALCIQALQAGGAQAIESLVSDAREGRMQLSDAMPYKEDTYFLPKPILHIHSTGEAHDDVTADRKAFRRLTYLPADQFEPYLLSLCGKSVFHPDGVACTFGVKTERTMANTRSRRPGQTEPGTLPYSVGLFDFAPGCGLYILFSFADKKLKEQMLALVGQLGFSGLGGKRSDGFGQFAVDQVLDLEGKLPPAAAEIARMLETKNAAYSMTLSLALPKDGELDSAMDSAYYTLVRRGGFANESAYKKAVIYAMAAGSCFKKQFAGDVYDVAGKEIGHPVYRYLKPMFVGVKL